jgi:hypothetical protein
MTQRIDFTGRALTIKVTPHNGCALFTATDGGAFAASYLTTPGEGLQPTAGAVRSIVGILVGMADAQWRGENS